MTPAILTLDLPLSVAQVAKLTPLSEPAIRARVASGELPARRVGGRIFLTMRDVEVALHTDEDRRGIVSKESV